MAAIAVLLLGTACSVSSPSPVGQDEVPEPGVRTSGPSENPDDARIRQAGSGLGGGVRIAGVALDDIRVLTTQSLLSICLDRPGEVTIDAIEPQLSQGQLRVEAFELVSVTSKRDDSRPFPSGPVVLSQSCGSASDASSAAGPAQGLAVRMRVRMLATQTAIAQTSVMRYRSGGRPYELPLSYSIAFCVVGDSTSKPCQPTG